MGFKIDLSKFKIDFSKLKINFDFLAKPLTTAISIDDDLKSIKVFKANADQKSFALKTETYKGKPFDENFYEMLKGTLNLQQFERSDKVSFVLPDHLFVTDTIKLPFIQKSALNTSLGLALDAIYGEKHNIKFNNFIISQNKQHAIFNVCGIRKDILSKINACLDECAVPVSNVTFASNASTNGAIALNPKLRNANFILLDIKHGFSRFSFVIAGKTVGFFSLPFGFEVLASDKAYSELSLFDHTPADLLVLNAQEKARKKQLTMLESNDDEINETDGVSDDTDKQPNASNTDLSNSSDNIEDFSDQDDFDFDDTDNVESTRSGALYKRVNRKLPKFMQRPIPQSREECISENFRVFIKWTLELVRNNPEIFSFGAPDSIVVNLPNRFSSLFPMNIEGTDVDFVRLSQSASDGICNNLELFGALYAKKYNKVNNF